MQLVHYIDNILINNVIKTLRMVDISYSINTLFNIRMYVICNNVMLCKAYVIFIICNVQHTFIVFYMLCHNMLCSHTFWYGL